MKMSETLDKIGPALCKAQTEMAGAKKDSTNPFFKAKYADLTSVWKACKDALHSNGLSVIQSPISQDGRIGVTTMLLHSSGQYVVDEYTLGVKKENDPQADGSSITYARRYALAAFVGICPEDDDGEKSMSRNYTAPPNHPNQPMKTPPKTDPPKSKKDLPPGERLLQMKTNGYIDLLKEAYVQCGLDEYAVQDDPEIVKGVVKQRQVLEAALRIMKENAGAA